MLGFSPHLFWDCDPRAIDFDAQAGFVIGRVFSRGTWSDWKALKQRYSLDRLRQEVVRLRNLDPRSQAFCALVLNLEPEAFRCSKHASSSPAP